MLFFFSSRRRHTRCLSDWSSDVCSSDLAEGRRLDSGDLGKGPALVGGGEDAVVMLNPHVLRRGRTLHQAVHVLSDGVVRLLRSEERRVGKECRRRWSPSDQKNKRM